MSAVKQVSAQQKSWLDSRQLVTLKTLGMSKVQSTFWRIRAGVHNGRMRLLKKIYAAVRMYFKI